MRTPLQSRRCGLSLVELLVAMVISSVVAGVAVRLSVSVTRQAVDESTNVRAEEAVWLAETALRTALRLAGADAYLTGATQIVADPFGTGLFKDVRVVSDFNPPDGDTTDPLEDITFRADSDTLFVSWQAGGNLEAYAYPVRSLAFQYYKDDGTPATTQTAVDQASRVIFTIKAPADPESTRLITRKSWTWLRNR